MACKSVSDASQILDREIGDSTGLTRSAKAAQGEEELRNAAAAYYEAGRRGCDAIPSKMT